MPTWTEIGNILVYYGFTPHTLTPLILFALCLYYFLNKGIDSLKSDISNLKHCIVELQTILKTKDKKLMLQYAVDKFGQSHSPIVLKDKYRPFIIDSGIDIQINNKEDELMEWLKNQKPKTGIDAQDKILDLITSDDISKYLNLSNYKQNMYEKGLTSQDVAGVLWIYLSEVLIPKLKFDIKK